MRKSNNPAPAAAWLGHTCGFCGAKGGAYLTHYEILRCTCGHFFWALQPNAGGPLKLFQHPGFYPITVPNLVPRH